MKITIKELLSYSCHICHLPLVRNNVRAVKRKLIKLSNPADNLCFTCRSKNFDHYSSITVSWEEKTACLSFDKTIQITYQAIRYNNYVINIEKDKISVYFYNSRINLKLSSKPINVFQDPNYLSEMILKINKLMLLI